MRLWSIHPKYLDSKGLVATWREGLLAQKCLEGKTKGYKNHPQLSRFKNTSDPLNAIGSYLHAIFTEAVKRNYNFDKTKIINQHYTKRIPTTTKQLLYEWQHFLNKINHRAPELYKTLAAIKTPDPHPLFQPKKGPIEEWEIIP